MIKQGRCLENIFTLLYVSSYTMLMLITLGFGYTYTNKQTEEISYGDRSCEHL